MRGHPVPRAACLSSRVRAMFRGKRRRQCRTGRLRVRERLGQRDVFVRRDGAQIEQDAVVFDARDDRRSQAPQPLLERVRASAVVCAIASSRSAARRRARCRRRSPRCRRSAWPASPRAASARRERVGARADLVGRHRAASAAPAPSSRRGRRRAARASPRAPRRSSCPRAARASADGVRIRSSSAARPTMMPACGPPSSLSPLKQTTSTPAASAVGHDRLVARAPSAVASGSASPSQPLPRSSATGIVELAAECRRDRPAPGVR